MSQNSLDYLENLQNLYRISRESLQNLGMKARGYTHVGFIRITVKFQLVDPYFFPKKGIVLILILSAM